MTAHDPRVTLTEAEMQRLTGAFASSTRAPGHLAFLAREVVEGIIAARLGRVGALVDVWTYGYFPGAPSQRYADALRAALSAPVSASQDHDGAEGQGEWPHRPEWHVHNHPPYEPTCNERRVDGQLRGACLNDDGSPR